MEEILRYFPDLSQIQIERYSKLQNIYTLWNEKINLISRKDIDQLYIRHVLHSLTIARFVTFKTMTQVMDAGTGGGFPGIPLAIMFPDSRFLLVDSIGKKIKVVQDVIEQLKLENCKAITGRAEKVNDKFDFIVSRAVAPLPTLYNWTRKNISTKKYNTIANGLICLKGGDLSDELKDFKKKVVVKNISEYFKEEFFETKKIAYVPIN